MLKLTYSQPIPLCMIIPWALPGCSLLYFYRNITSQAASSAWIWTLWNNNCGYKWGHAEWSQTVEGSTIIGLWVDSFGFLTFSHLGYLFGKIFCTFGSARTTFHDCRTPSSPRTAYTARPTIPKADCPCSRRWGSLYLYRWNFIIYGLPAFRPAWGQLAAFRIKLGKNVIFQALSGTQPEKKIIEHLLFDEKKKFCSIKLIAQTRCMRHTQSLAHYRISGIWTLSFPILIPQISGSRKLSFSITTLMNALPLLFILTNASHNNSATKGLWIAITVWCRRGIWQRCMMISNDQMGHVGFSMRQRGQPRYSLLFLFKLFWYLIWGLDVADIDVVIQYGVPRDVSTTLQRGGRGGRTKTAEAIYLIMYEPWVMNIDLSNIKFNVSDPDHPTVEKLSKTSNKQERTGIGVLKIIQSADCLRMMYANYLGDKTAECRCCLYIYWIMNILFQVW